MKMGGQDDQDQETGEAIFDHETGEEVLNLHPPTSQPEEQPRDAETGEPESEQKTSKKKPFQIPRSALQLKPSNNNNIMLRAPSYNPLTSTSCLEKKVERVSQNVSPLVFLLPTLFLFPGWATVLLSVFEVVSHAWSHKKNKQHGDSCKMYRSPLNLFTSQFCAICRSDSLMHKISKMQDQRLLQIHNRKIGYCTYVEKMSVIT